MKNLVNVAVVGAGLIGQRRAEEVAQNPNSRCIAIADVDEGRAKIVAESVNAEFVTTDWRDVLSVKDLDVVIVSTPNGYLCEIARAALNHGYHVLVEKPMGRNVEEAIIMAKSAEWNNRILKVGFNHRYHPAIFDAHYIVKDGRIGDILNMRCRYGHGGRAGYELEWRGDKNLAGGGELTDQGVHVIDLIYWFAGIPSSVFGYTQRAFWPLGELEDNGFGLFSFKSGAVAQFHTSWTQWKNLFSFEVFGSEGAVIVDGLGRSYGTETLITHMRRPEGGVPITNTTRYEGHDISWKREWEDFLGAILYGTPMINTAEDGIGVMNILAALYKSSELNSAVSL